MKKCNPKDYNQRHFYLIYMHQTIYLGSLKPLDRRPEALYLQSGWSIHNGQKTTHI